MRQLSSLRIRHAYKAACPLPGKGTPPAPVSQGQAWCRDWQTCPCTVSSLYEKMKYLRLLALSWLWASRGSPCDLSQLRGCGHVRRLNPINSQVHRLPDQGQPIPKKRGRSLKEKLVEDILPASKRGPGRPKGIKNKKTLEKEARQQEGEPIPRRKPGRPKGSKTSLSHPHLLLVLPVWWKFTS